MDEFRTGGEGLEHQGRQHREAGGGASGDHGKRLPRGDQQAPDGQDGGQPRNRIARDSREKSGRDQRVIIQRSGGAAINRAPEDGIIPQREGAGKQLAFVGIKFVRQPDHRPAKSHQHSGQQSPPSPAPQA